jgi:hypothetical protein
MRCDQALTLLRAFAAPEGRAPEALDVVEAEAAGWIEADEVEAVDDDASAREAVKGATRALAEARAALRGLAPFERELQEAKVGELEDALRRHRSALLDAQADRMRGAASRDTDAGRYMLTWRGRELLDELGPRVQRCADLPVATFQSGMDELRKRLRGLAAAAAAVAKKLSTEHLAIDEMSLRYASLSLAASSPTAAAGWDGALKLLEKGPVPPADQPLAAEIAACSSDPTGVVNRLHAALQRGGSVTPVGVALALAVSPDPDALLRQAGAARDRLDGVAPVSGVVRAVRVRASDVLVASAGADVAAVAFVRGQLFGLPDAEADLVAAMLALSGRPPEQAVALWRTLEAEVARLHPGQGALVAAMLALLDGSADALLDDLRLAAEAVSAEKLGVGGFEILVQAARLLVLVALADVPGSLGPRAATRHLALPALAAAAPAALLGAQPVLLAAVASSSLTNMRYYRYRHPAHRSGVYGG